jgi:ATP-dependent RNA helicase DDX27
MLFSATLNTAVEDLAALAMVKPVRIHANAMNRVVDSLEQEFVKAPSEELREAVLLSLVTRNYRKSVIIFCATRKACHRVAIILGLCGLRFTEIHGSLSQTDRVRALEQFQQSEADVLIATDLAARGLDLQNVETVINLHMPLDIARYIHRVGRTARMGRAGRAVTIYTESEYAKVKALGKQVCTKVKSKVVKRSVASDAVQQMAEKIKMLTEDIEAILVEESLERETRLADVLAKKTENLEKHKDSINSRPEKQWFQSNKEKQQLKQEDKTRAKSLRMEDGHNAGRGKREGGRTGALKRKFQQKKEQEKADREADFSRARKAAKRQRRAERPQRGFEDMPQKTRRGR